MDTIRDSVGRFIKGLHSSPITEFKKGSQTNKGRHHTEETKKKIANSLKGGSSWNKGLHKSGASGKKRSEETNLKSGRSISIALKGKYVGEKSPLWKGGEKARWARTHAKQKARGFVLISVKNPYDELVDYHHIHPSLPYTIPCPRRIHTMFAGREKTHYQNVNAMLGIISFDVEELPEAEVKYIEGKTGFVPHPCSDPVNISIAIAGVR